MPPHAPSSQQNNNIYALPVVVAAHGKVATDRSGGAASNHDILCVARARHPTRRLYALGPRRARAYGRLVSRHRRRVRIFINIVFCVGDLGEGVPSSVVRFATVPGADDADLRMTYCAFVVCALLDDWSCIDLPRALLFIQRCRVRSLSRRLACHLLKYDCVCVFCLQTYEGGYGQTPLSESLGGPTYCALASMHLVPADHPCASQARLQPTEWRATVRWLLHTQSQQSQRMPETQTESKLGGGFAGRTNKLADACYGFWCCAALAVRPFPFPFLIPSPSCAVNSHTPHGPANPFPSSLHLAPCFG